MKDWINSHLHNNNGKLFGIIQLYRISGVCRGEMVRRVSEYESNWMCPICKANTYNWKWMLYKPKPKRKFYKPVFLFGVMLSASSAKKCS